MDQKRVIGLVVIILVVTIGIAMYLSEKNTGAVITEQNIPKAVTITNQKEEVIPIQEKKETIVAGKVRSMNATQIFIELADKTGAAINISPATPVRNESDDKSGNLSILKMDSMVSVKVDGDNNAVEILIKK